MNWKAALVLFLIFFASAVATINISLNLPLAGRISISEKTTLATACKPMGDPVGGGGHPS